MSEQRIDEAWLFKINSKEEISKWVTNLKYSYLWKRPSFRDEGDYILLTLNFISKTDLFDSLKVLDIKLRKIPRKWFTSILNKIYSLFGVVRWKSEIKDFPEFEQPLNCKIHNIPVFVWIENKNISFSFSGSKNDYEVSEEDYENCLQLETLIDRYNLTQKVNRDIESNIGCITKSKYPEL
jgi:hypothetical protein